MLMGAMIAIAAGTTEPKPVRIAVTMKNTQGMSATRPPTTFTSACTIQSTVPLSFASAKRYVTPTRMRNRSAGNPDRSVSTFLFGTLVLGEDVDTLLSGFPQHQSAEEERDRKSKSLHY